jgi:hypothetical protein
MSESKVALWRERVTDWKASGLTADEYGAQHGLVASTLRWWALRLERHYKEEARPESKAKQARAVEPQQAAPELKPVRARRRRAKKSKPAKIRVAKLVPVAPATDATRSGAVVVELSEGRARIAVERGADLKVAAKLVATLATTRKR